MNKLLAVLKNCVSGIYSLLQDPAGTLCLLSLSAVTFLAFHGKLGDIATAACFTLISSLAVLMKHKSFQNTEINDTPIPTPPITETIKEIISNISPKGTL